MPLAGCGDDGNQRLRAVRQRRRLRVRPHLPAVRRTTTGTSATCAATRTRTCPARPTSRHAHGGGRHGIEPSPPPAVPLQLFLDHPREHREGLRPRDQPPVDEEHAAFPRRRRTRRRRDRGASGPRAARSRGTPSKAATVQADGAGVPLEVGDPEPLRVLEQPVVHLPEPALVPRALRRFRRLGRVLVPGQREVPEHEPDPAPVAILHRAQRGQHAAAERALELGELHDGDRRVRRPAAGRSGDVDRHPRRRQGDGRRDPRAQLGQEPEAALGQAILASGDASPGLRVALAFVPRACAGAHVPRRRAALLHLGRSSASTVAPRAASWPQQLALDQVLERLALQVVLPASSPR